jgi:tetratricopeptide (TPR) repeat protein
MRNWNFIFIAFLLALFSAYPANSAQKQCNISLEKTFPADQAINAYEQGYAFYRKGLFPAAEQKLIEAIKHEPNLIKAHYWLGKLYKETGRLESAIFHWEEVERLNNLIHDRRIALSIQNNEYPARAQILRIINQRALAKEKFAKGIYLLDKGHWNGAEVELREAVKLFPANHKFLLTLARVLWDKDEKSASVKFYRDLLNLSDVSFKDFAEGINRMMEIDMAYIAAPIVSAKKEKFARIPEFADICKYFAGKEKTDIVAAGKVVKRMDGQVIINMGMNKGIGLKDEYSLKLRAFAPGEPITDPDTRKIIGRSPMITKVNRQSSWALIRREMGSGVKAGDLIEIKKTSR